MATNTMSACAGPRRAQAQKAECEHASLQGLHLAFSLHAEGRVKLRLGPCCWFVLPAGLRWQYCVNEEARGTELELWLQVFPSVCFPGGKPLPAVRKVTYRKVRC